MELKTSHGTMKEVAKSDKSSALSITGTVCVHCLALEHMAAERVG